MKKQIKTQSKAQRALLAAAIATLGVTLFPSADAFAKPPDHAQGNKNKTEAPATTDPANTGDDSSSSGDSSGSDVSGLELFSTSVQCSDGVFEGTTACAGVFAGNDSNSISSSTKLFGSTGWEVFTKIDTISGVGSYVNSLLEFSGPLDGNELKNDIEWALPDQSALEGKELFFSVKGGDSFSAYLWDGNTLSGKFNTAGIVNGGGKAPGLSHLSVYYRNVVTLPPSPTNEVPTPAAVLPIIGSLFGAAAKRKEEGEDVAE